MCKAGLDLGCQTEQLMSNILPQVIVRVTRELSPGQHCTGTMANAILAYWEEWGQQVEQVDS